jgi:hypothetical protein
MVHVIDDITTCKTGYCILVDELIMNRDTTVSDRATRYLLVLKVKKNALQVCTFSHEHTGTHYQGLPGKQRRRIYESKIYRLGLKDKHAEIKLVQLYKNIPLMPWQHCVHWLMKARESRRKWHQYGGGHWDRPDKVLLAASTMST